MTRGPAKPMSARGSARMTSPSIAKLAVTPPVVGSVSTEMNGNAASSKRARAAENDKSFKSWTCSEGLACQVASQATRMGMCFVRAP